MKPGDTDKTISAEDLLKALAGDDRQSLHQLDGRNIKPTIDFLKAARRRLDALLSNDTSKSGES